MKRCKSQLLNKRCKSQLVNRRMNFLVERKPSSKDGIRFAKSGGSVKSRATDSVLMWPADVGRVVPPRGQFFRCQCQLGNAGHQIGILGDVPQQLKLFTGPRSSEVSFVMPRPRRTSSSVVARSMVSYRWLADDEKRASSHRLFESEIYPRPHQAQLRHRSRQCATRPNTRAQLR